MSFFLLNYYSNAVPRMNKPIIMLWNRVGLFPSVQRMASRKWCICISIKEVIPLCWFWEEISYLKVGIYPFQVSKMVSNTLARNWKICQKFLRENHNLLESRLESRWALAALETWSKEKINKLSQGKVSPLSAGTEGDAGWHKKIERKGWAGEGKNCENGKSLLSWM